MLTFGYRSGWIHENFTTGEVRAQFADYTSRRVKSIHAAKLAITRNGFKAQGGCHV